MVIFVDFSSTLNESLGFAGSANYCPVLVGALAGIERPKFAYTPGARYGFQSIPAADLEHCSEKLRDQINTLTESLVISWPEQQ